MQWSSAALDPRGSQIKIIHTILTEMMADEFNFLRPEIKNYKAEADADLIPIPGQLELHGRLAVYMLLCSLFVADLIVGMEELELHYRSRGRYNFQKIKTATISVRMVNWWTSRIFSFFFVRLGGGDGGIRGDREGGGCVGVFIENSCLPGVGGGGGREGFLRGI